MDGARVSLLVRGKTGQSRPERLIELLGRLSYDVRIEATPSPALTRTDAGLGVGDGSAPALRRRGGHR